MLLLLNDSAISLNLNTFAPSSSSPVENVGSTTPPVSYVQHTSLPKPDPAFPPQSPPIGDTSLAVLEKYRRLTSTVPYDYFTDHRPIYHYDSHFPQHCRNVSWGTLCEGCCYDRHDEYECGTSDCSDTNYCTSTTEKTFQYYGLATSEAFHSEGYWGWRYKSQGSQSCIPKFCTDTLTNKLLVDYPSNQYSTLLPDTTSNMYQDQFCYRYQDWWYVYLFFTHTHTHTCISNTIYLVSQNRYWPETTGVTVQQPHWIGM